MARVPGNRPNRTSNCSGHTGLVGCLLLLTACGDSQGGRVRSTADDAAVMLERDAAIPSDASTELHPADASAPIDVPTDAAVVSDAAPEDSGSSPGCEVHSLESMRGHYADSTGREHWFSATATAQLYTIVPKGAAVPGALPTLFEVRDVCGTEARGHFVATDKLQKTTRVDWLTEQGGIALCVSSTGTESVAALMAAPNPDAQQLALGCYGGAWIHVTKVIAK